MSIETDTREVKAMTSLKDIAQVCGVSVATVSKALNNHSDVSEARREQIKSKARELGYFPNQAARALKTRSTMDIGVLFADAHNSGLTHPYFSQVLEGLKIRTEERGYDLTFIGIKSKRNKMTFLEHCVYRRREPEDGVYLGRHYGQARQYHECCVVAVDVCHRLRKAGASAVREEVGHYGGDGRVGVGVLE